MVHLHRASEASRSEVRSKETNDRSGFAELVPINRMLTKEQAGEFSIASKSSRPLMRWKFSFLAGTSP